MAAFQSDITPQLLSLFETLFSVQLTDESNRIRDVLSQLDAQLFISYTKPHATKINTTIESGVFSPTWAPAPPPGKGVADRDPSPFVFTVLLDLVIVHTESSTTSYPLPLRVHHHLSNLHIPVPPVVYHLPTPIDASYPRCGVYGSNACELYD
jgi:exocyst complex component 2